MSKLNFLLSFIVIFFSSTHLSAQIQKGELKKGEKALAEIQPTETHRYTLALDKDQYVFLKLMQQGVDVKINTYDPSGDKIEEFDSPNGKVGPELMTIESNEKGIYSLIVSPFDENEPIGNYTLSVHSIAPKATTKEAKIDQFFTAWNSKETPGAAVSVVKDGKIIYKKGYGMATLEYDVPISPSTVFHIASISKQFTAFSILLLEKEGKLKLDDDIRKYVPEVPDFGKTITLRHLANHTSGLRDQWNLLVLAGWRMDDVITTEQVLKLVSKQKELNFEPGEEYLYCNTGFTLLAEVVARVSGKSFAEFTDEQIFQPLGMTNTLFYDDHEKIVQNRAYSYRGAGDGYKKSVLSYANAGATSLFTTVEDLSLWAMNFENPKVGDSELIMKMKERGILNNGKPINYALGQSVETYKGLNEVGHGGADAGYRTQISRFPDHKFSVTVFSNDGAFNPWLMAHKVVDIYLEDKFIQEEKNVPKEPEEVAENIAIADETLDEYVGDFELEPAFIISIRKENGHLIGKATGQPALPLKPVSITEFEVQGIDAKIVFHRGGNGKVELIKLHQGGQIMDAPRVKEFDREAVDLSEYEGRFYSEELSTEYMLKVKDGKLYAMHPRLSDAEFRPSKKDGFMSNGAFGAVEFIRGGNGMINGFKVNSGRVRNLLFERRK